MRQTTEMFGIVLFDSDEYCDVLEDCSQYADLKWHLSDMQKYDGMVVALYFDGRIRIFDKDNRIVFEGSLLESSDFRRKLAEKIVFAK